MPVTVRWLARGYAGDSVLSIAERIFVYKTFSRIPPSFLAQARSDNGKHKLQYTVHFHLTTRAGTRAGPSLKY